MSSKKLQKSIICQGLPLTQLHWMKHLYKLLFLIVLLTPAISFGAGCAGTGTCYWVGGTGSWSGTTHWATASGGAVTGSIPLSSDTAIFDTASAAAAYTVTVDGSPTVATMTYDGVAFTTSIISLSGSLTVTNTLTLNGNSAINRPIIQSSVLGTPRTISAGTIVTKWTDFMDITGAGGADWILTNQVTDSSGDAGGNSGITFTTSAPQTWSGTSGGNWSDNAWSGRVPLPQDDALFNGVTFISAQTISSNMPRSGHNIDWTGVAYSGTKPVWSISATSIYGSITMTTNINQTSAGLITMSGRAAGMPAGGWTLTSAGNTWVEPFTINAPGGKVILQDALSINSSFGLTVTNGTFNANNFNVTTNAINSNTGGTRAITMGTGTWTLTGTGTVWNVGSALSLTSAGSTIAITDVSATSKTFAGVRLTYNKLTITGGGSGAVIITGTNTFNTFTIGAPKTVQFTAATTNTFNNFVANGSAGNVITISSVTAATHTLKQVGGIVSGKYLNLTNSIATGGALWYAANSVNGGGNTGWIFTGAPSRGLIIDKTKVKIQNSKVKLQFK